jgi:hypothetical protein
MERVNQGERIAAASGIALILFMFIFKWFGLKFAGPTGIPGAPSIAVEGSRNAWGSYGWQDLLLFITAIAAIGLAAIAAQDMELDLPIGASAIVAGLGALSVLVIVISLISPPSFGVNLSGSGVSHTRKIGAFLGLIAAIGIVVGGWMAMQEEGAAYASDDYGGGGPQPPAGGPPPPPPPPPPAPPPPPPPPPPPSGP